MEYKKTPLEKYQEVDEGVVILAPNGSTRSASVRADMDSVSITSPSPSIGINIDTGGITIQGSQMNTAFGSSISKGPYTENNKSPKPYTYTETVYLESKAKEEAYNKSAQYTGSDAAGLAIQFGVAPIITDVSAGPAPHVHTISMKHVHKIEPAYVYEMPQSVTNYKSGIQSFLDFLK